MASAWVYRERRNGVVRYRAQYRLGGRESKVQHGGSFRTKRLAEKRRDWIAGELASLRVPDLRLVDRSETTRTLRLVAEAWRASRVDVATGTAQTHRVNLNRILPVLGDRPIDEIKPDDVVELVSKLHADRLKRESIRKTLNTLSMVLEHAGRNPNPAGDKRVRLPQENRAEVNPPTAAHVEAVYGLVATSYRLALLVLDATGMRVSEIELLTWGDVDEPEGRWRVSQASAKTSKVRWVPVPDVLFKAVTELVPRTRVHVLSPGFAIMWPRLRRLELGVVAQVPHDLSQRVGA